MNPKNASDTKDAAISDIGKPSRHLGTSAVSRRSLIPANNTIASVKPTPEKAPFSVDIRNLAFPCISRLSMHTPSTAQFVVIRGR